MAQNAATQEIAGTMVCGKTSASRDELLELDSPVWQKVPVQEVDMAATPLANQPSPYIKATRDEKEIGKVKKLSVRALHNGRELFFFFEWASPEPNYEIGDLNVFPDGVSVLFAMKDDGECPIKEMGKQDSPTNSWYWRADFDDKPMNQIARGLATSLYTDESSIVANSRWQNGKWQVIMGRALEVSGGSEESVALKIGGSKRVGFAAWEGANGERGGVKSFSKEWRELIIAT